LWKFLFYDCILFSFFLVLSIVAARIQFRIRH
jgi:hypothetical protein